MLGFMSYRLPEFLTTVTITLLDIFFPFSLFLLLSTSTLQIVSVFIVSILSLYILMVIELKNHDSSFGNRS